MKYNWTFCQDGGFRNYGPICIDLSVSNWDTSRPLPGPEEVPDSLVNAFREGIARCIGYEAMNALIRSTFEDGKHIGIEIGVDVGDGAVRLLRTNPRLLYLVDPWMRSDIDSWYSDSQDKMDARHKFVCDRFKDDERVNVIRATSENILSQIKSVNGKVDWIYIDGDHTAAAVEKDILLSADCVLPGGLIFGDDLMSCPCWKKDVGDGLNAALEKLGDRVQVLSRSGCDPFALMVLK